MPFDAVLLAPGFSHDLGASVAVRLGVELCPVEERDFADGEHKCRPLASVRGRDAYLVASLGGDRTMSPNDKLCRTLFLIGALRDASARSVTAVVPYLCYARKDRQTKARDPVTSRHVVELFESMGIDRLVTLDVHNLAAFQNAARGATDHLEATMLFVDHLRDVVGDDPVTVVAPDLGGVKRARRFRDQLASSLGSDVELALTEKFRSRDIVSGRGILVGDVAGRVAVVYDDLISSGRTMLRVANLLSEQGARSIHLAATHGMFDDAATALFTSEAVSTVVVTDSVPQDRLPAAVVAGRLVVLGIDELLARAITIIDQGGSLTDLLRLEE